MRGVSTDLCDRCPYPVCFARIFLRALGGISAQCDERERELSAVVVCQTDHAYIRHVRMVEDMAFQLRGSNYSM